MPSLDTATHALALQLRPCQPSSRRNGKIARLPKQTRDIINRMLDDGLPARVIIDELGEAGAGLNAQNLTNWVQGGYQDYLKAQEAIARAKAQMEFATDLLAETGDVDPLTIHRACDLVAGLQLFYALREYGDEALKKILQGNPAKYLTVLNTVATMANSSVKLEQHRFKKEALDVLKNSLSSQIKPDQASPHNSPQECGAVVPPASRAVVPPVHPARTDPPPPQTALTGSDSSPIKPDQAPQQISQSPEPFPVPASGPRSQDPVATSSLINVNQAPHQI
jgi:hypothetical protein